MFSVLKFKVKLSIVFLSNQNFNFVHDKTLKYSMLLRSNY